MVLLKSPLDKKAPIGRAEEGSTQMFKKIALSCMALVALAALALPAVASAKNTPTLLDSEGVVKVGSKTWLTNVGELTLTNTSGAGLFHCTTADLTGEVTSNSTGNIAMNLTLATIAGTGSIHPTTGDKECTGSMGSFGMVVSTPVCLRSNEAMATGEFQITGGACSGAAGNVKITTLSTTAGACEYETTSSVRGDFTTGGAQATLTVRNTQAGSGIKLIKGGFLCPSSSMLKASFGLETDPSGTPIWINT
jgi:hypothetical protein